MRSKRRAISFFFPAAVWAESAVSPPGSRLSFRNRTFSKKSRAAAPGSVDAAWLDKLTASKAARNFTGDVIAYRARGGNEEFKTPKESAGLSFDFEKPDYSIKL